MTRLVHSVCALAAGGGLLAGCGGGGSSAASVSPAADPRQAFAAAKQRIDAAAALHFSLDSQDAGGVDQYIRSGDGDATRPNGFAGMFKVHLSSLGDITLGVLSVGGSFYVQLPIINTWEKTDPAKYGFSDPGGLIDPSTGLSSLLVKATAVTSDGRDRYQGEELDEYHASVPGDLVGHLLTSADPTRPVDAEVGISVQSGEVRRVRLTGPFFLKTRDSTYTLILSKYGESVTVTPPAA